MQGNVVHVWTTPGYTIFPFTFLIGPDWGCNLVTWALTLVPSVIFLVFAYVAGVARACGAPIGPDITPPVASVYRAPRIHLAVLVVGVVLLLAALVVLAWTSLGDPGYLPRKTRAEFEEERAMLQERGELDRYAPCERCNIHRGPRVAHCFSCDRCVHDLDHHCPWHGKCIAGNNIVPFHIYMWAVVVLVVYLGVSLFIWFGISVSRN